MTAVAVQADFLLVSWPVDAMLYVMLYVMISAMISAMVKHPGASVIAKGPR